MSDLAPTFPLCWVNSKMRELTGKMEPTDGFRLGPPKHTKFKSLHFELVASI